MRNNEHHNLDPVKHPTFLVVQFGENYLVDINERGNRVWGDDIADAIEYTDSLDELTSLRKINGPSVRIIRQSR